MIFVAIFQRYNGHEIVGVRPRSERVAVGWLSDPINSQGVNKQLTAAMGERGKEGEGTVFLFRCLWLPHGWAGSRGKRRAALGVRRKERQSAMRSVLMLRRFGTGCAKWRKSDIYDPYSSPPKSSCESNNVYSFSQPRSQLPCFVMTMRKS